jgi:sugar/nucleoside kinase (ribokinase family)
VVAAARLAHERGVKVMLDPAPAQELPAEIYPHVDLLTPNETEAATLTSCAIGTVDEAALAATRLLSFGVRRVIVKMGSQGALVADEMGTQFFPAFPVTAVDTVAAGDAFNGAMAVALSENHPFDTAILWGLAGDLVISSAAVRLENTSTYLVDEGYPTVADYEVITMRPKDKINKHSDLRCIRKILAFQL